MKRYLQTALAACTMLAVSACAAPTTVTMAPSDSSAVLAPEIRTDDYGNIRWNKATIHVYKSKGADTALLTFWAKDGYFTYPISCKSGGQLVATPGTVKGNPNRYDRVKYSFVAKTGKPDQCTFTAVLDNTGSPPIAILTIYLNS
jgi:hypothetical protein